MLCAAEGWQLTHVCGPLYDASEACGFDGLGVGEGNTAVGVAVDAAGVGVRVGVAVGATGVGVRVGVAVGGRGVGVFGPGLAAPAEDARDKATLTISNTIPVRTSIFFIV